MTFTINARDEAAAPRSIDPRTLRLNPAEKGGEGGDPDPASATNADFVAWLSRYIPAGTVLALCSKQGDPDSGGWAAFRPGDVRTQCPPSNNNYFNCSSFRPGADGSLAAKREAFGAYHVMVFDDVGTKVPLDRLDGIDVSWKLETSPGNFQIGVRLDQPLTEPSAVEALQRAINEAGLCDPGAQGLARWARLPNAINGKSKHRDQAGAPFRCRLVTWKPEVAYSVTGLLQALGIPAAPPSPPLPEVPASPAPVPAHFVSAVYQPRPDKNPVVQALKEKGLYKKQLSPGRHDITCPWASEHTDGLDTGAAYFEPDAEHPSGGFRCHHSHGDQYRLSELLTHIGLPPGAGRNKAVIRCQPGELNLVVSGAESTLAQQGSFYQAGGVIVRLKPNLVTQDVEIEPLTEQALTKELAAAADFMRPDKSGKWLRCDPPVRPVNLLHRSQTYDALPHLERVARQPFFRQSNGELVITPGFDQNSRVYGAFEAASFPPVETSRAAAELALAELRELVAEFHFAGPEDEAAAVCAMLTAAIRPSLAVAPAFNVSASAYGSGKTYLCSVISPFAGPGEPMNVSYPKTSEEATKVVQSLLLKKPAVILFDDMDSDWLPHGAINRMLTSESMTDRLLGQSKAVTVQTNVLVMGSGNNVDPVRDLRRRVVTIRLAPRTGTPTTWAYSGRPADVVREKRGYFVSLALTIIAAFKAAGSPAQEVPHIGSFGQWSDWCRLPLLWLGLPDPATSLLEQVKADPDMEPLGELLRAWHSRFGAKPVMVRTVIKAATELLGDALTTALSDLPIFDHGTINPSKMGWYLKKNANRIVHGLELRREIGGERTCWAVVEAPELSIA